MSLYWAEVNMEKYKYNDDNVSYKYLCIYRKLALNDDYINSKNAIKAVQH